VHTHTNTFAGTKITCIFEVNHQADSDADAASIVITQLIKDGMTAELDGTYILEFTGTKTVLNTCLPLLIFSPKLNYNGKDYKEATIRIDDLGSGHGATNNLVATAYLTVDLAAVNDAPVATAPSTDLTVKAGRVAIYQGFKVEDVDYEENWGSLIKVTIECLGYELNTPGFDLSLAVTNGCHFTEGSVGHGERYERFVFECSHTNIGRAMTALHIFAKTDAKYCDTKSRLKMTFDDQGNTGSGGALTAEVVKEITISCESEL